MTQNNFEMVGQELPPTKEYLFVGDWRDSSQLCREDAERTYVNQNHADVVKKGEILHSEGFSDCSGMVLVNIETGESALVHLVDWNLTDTQYSELSQLSKGQYRLFAVCGGRGVLSTKLLMDDKVSDFRRRFGECCGGEIVGFQDFKLDTGHYHWSMSYDTEMKLIKTYSKKDGKVREFDLNKLGR